MPDNLLTLKDFVIKNIKINDKLQNVGINLKK